MTAGHDRHRDYAALAVSLALGAIFVYGGIDKIRDPQQFADNIAGFAILPAAFINLLALTLPLFEVACGLLLLLPLTRRIGALAVALTSVVFFTALLSALLRGLTLDCGCFGISAPSRSKMWLELGARTGRGVVHGRAVRLFTLARASAGTHAVNPPRERVRG